MRGIKKNANAKTLILTISPTHMQQTTPPLALICFVSVSLPLLSFVDRWCTNKKMNFVGWEAMKKAGTEAKNEREREAGSKKLSRDSF